MEFLTRECEVPFLPIYLSDTDPELFVVVDREDYVFATQWRWRPKYDKHGRKLYAYRVVGRYEKGKRLKTISVYLHKEIVKRTAKRKRTKHHKMGDHRDGNSQNCRRSNLRWATASMNRKNINGKAAKRKRNTCPPLTSFTAEATPTSG